MTSKDLKKTETEVVVTTSPKDLQAGVVYACLRQHQKKLEMQG
jgi:hypothetical protein